MATARIITAIVAFSIAPQIFAEELGAMWGTAKEEA